MATTKNKKTTSNNKKSIKSSKNTSKKSITTTQKVIKPNKNDIFKQIKGFFKNLKNKFNNLSKPVKILIYVLVFCSVVLILEGLLILTINKQKNNGQVFYDVYNSVIVDGDSTVAVGHTDIKETMFDTNVKDDRRGKITKYDYKGNIEFQKIFEDGLATSFKSVINVDDGYVVVGTGIFSEQEKTDNGQEAVIIKYDKDGNIIWKKFYSVITNTSFSKVIEVEDGYIAVGQSIYANLEVGNHTTGGAIIVKYDKDGNEIWHNNHGGTKSGNFNDVVVVGDNIYVVGKDGSDWGNIVKYDKNGKYQWHKNYAYTDGSGFMGIAYSNNYLYVVGSKKVFDHEVNDEDDRATTNTDAVFIKYDLDGNIIFEKTFGGSSYEKYNSIIEYHNNFYIVGHICSKDAGLKITNTTPEKMTGLIVRYDINGYMLKKETLGGSNNDNITDIVTDTISFYAVGYSNSNDGNISKSNNNNKDYFSKLIKLNSKFKIVYVK